MGPGFRRDGGFSVDNFARKISGESPMLFTCLPPGTPIEGRFPGPVHARGKWFTVDIHCHVHLDKADEMVKPHWTPSATRR
jgi:hypothetical protein